jgi:hypothetical protein
LTQFIKKNVHTVCQPLVDSSHSKKKNKIIPKKKNKIIVQKEKENDQDQETDYIQELYNDFDLQELGLDDEEEEEENENENEDED